MVFLRTITNEVVYLEICSRGGWQLHTEKIDLGSGRGVDLN